MANVTRRHWIAGAVVVALVAASVLYGSGLLEWAWVHMRGGRTVEEALKAYGPAAEGRLRPYFEAAELAYPPSAITLLAFKEERLVELWAESDGEQTFIRAYPILGASGGPGPKLREGDRQVPEGVYSIESLNPNSRFHLSMKLDYPNAFDRAKGAEDGRDKLGFDIFIHGKTASVGCLAMGDEAIEDLFLLAATVGAKNVQVLVCPNDLRLKTPPEAVNGPVPWLPELYASLVSELTPYRR